MVEMSLRISYKGIFVGDLRISEENVLRLKAVRHMALAESKILCQSPWSQRQGYKYLFPTRFDPHSYNYAEGFFLIMAYRMRYGRNRRRSYRYNRRRGVRTGRIPRRSRRSSYRRRSYRRRPRYTVSPFNKRKDAIRAGTSDGSSSAAISDGAENTFFIFCPTFLPGRSGNRPLYSHERHNSNIHFTGYREKALVKTSESVIWRRIVVWSHTRRLEAMPRLVDGGGSTQIRQRNITPQANTESFREWLFQGTQGQDYTTQTIHQAAVNRTTCTVSYDRTSVINPNMGPSLGNGKLMEKKFWNPGGYIKYDDAEAGSKDFIQPGWSGRSGSSRGNMYIIDIFNTPGVSSASGVFQPQGVTYWVEP